MQKFGIIIVSVFLEIMMRLCSKCDAGLDPLKKDTLCADCRRVSNRLYSQSEKGKAAIKKYRQSEKGKKARLEYEKSGRGKAVKEKYYQSEKGRAMQRRHAKKYRESEKGQLTRKRIRGEAKQKRRVITLAVKLFRAKLESRKGHVNLSNQRIPLVDYQTSPPIGYKVHLLTNSGAVHLSDQQIPLT